MSQLRAELSSAQGDDLDFAGAAQDIDADGFGVALESEVDRSVADAQVADVNLLQFLWQRGMVKVDAGFARADFKAKTSLQHKKDCPGSPGLRRAGNRIKGGALAGAAGEAADEFRQAPLLHFSGELEKRRQNAKSDVFLLAAQLIQRR